MSRGQRAAPTTSIARMGFLNDRCDGVTDERKGGLVHVQMSAYACPQCGCTVALDLARRRLAWHVLIEDGNPPSSTSRESASGESGQLAV